MMKINASRVSNVVDFTVDEQSLKKAKDAIESVQKFAEGIKPSLNMMKMRQQMALAERYAKNLRKTFQETGAAFVIPPFQTQPTPGTRPNGKPPGRPTGSTKPPKKDPAVVRAETASLRSQNFEFRASQYTGADPSTLKRANTLLAQQVELFKKGEISAAQLNQSMSHELDNIRRSHRAKVKEIEDEVRGRRRVKRELEAEAKLRQRIRDKERKEKARTEKREKDAQQRDRARRLDRVKEGALGLSPAVLGSSILGAGMFAGLSKVLTSLSDAAERINLVGSGARNVQANPNAIIAMKTWGEMNGVDSANFIKAIDNLKDVRERLGNSVLASEWDKKSGKWKGGDNGINDIMNQFGWNKEDIKRFQNNPLDFVQATVNAGQAQGMNSAQIGRLMENLGDDLMHYQRLFLDNGKQFMATVDLMNRTGASLTEQQVQAGMDYAKLAGTLSLIGEGFSNNMLLGFMDAMKGAPDFTKNVDTITYAAKELGKSLGEMAQAVAWLLDKIPGFNPENKHEDLNSSGLFYNDSWLGRLINGDAVEANRNKARMLFPDAIDPQTGAGRFMTDILNQPYQPPASSIAARSSYFQQDMANAAWSQQGQQQAIQNIIQIPTDAIRVNVMPDTVGLSNYFDARIDLGFKDFTQSLVLGVTGGQPASNF